MLTEEDIKVFLKYSILTARMIFIVPVAVVMGIGEILIKSIFENIN